VTTIICALFVSVCAGIIGILFKEKAQIKIVYQTEIENLNQQLLQEKTAKTREKVAIETELNHFKSLAINDLKLQFNKKEAALQNQIESLNQQLIEEKSRFEQNWKQHKLLITNDLKIQFNKKEAALQNQIESLNQQLIEGKSRFEQNWKQHKLLITNDLKIQFNKKEATLQNQIESLNQQLIEEKDHFEQNWKQHKLLITNDLKTIFDKKEAALQSQVKSLNQQLIEIKAHYEQRLNQHKSVVNNNLNRRYDEKEATFHNEIENLNQQLIGTKTHYEQSLNQHKSLITNDLKIQFEEKETAFQNQIENLNQQLIQEKQRFEKEKMLRRQWMKTIFDSKNITTFENLIHIATADGQLTLNEKALLQKKAVELGLNYDDYLDKINELLQGNVKETNLIDKDKEKGNDFEKYIVQKFTKQYFKILEWAGDKYVEGRFAQTTLEPDLKLQFKYKNIQIDFAVECKYRSHFYKNGIEWASEKQLNNYKKFSVQKEQPVFIIIGVGGVASAPDELYLVRLSDIDNTFLDKPTLAPFKKMNFKDNNIFFDYTTQSLK
jgi:hypothetical protein